MSKDEERYDVSQHEDITPGPWWINHHYEDGVKSHEIWNGTREENDRAYVASIDGTEPDLNLIGDAPEILDALKKAYEREDEHNKQVYSPNARKTLVEHCVPILNYIEMYRGNVSDEELMQDILTGGYYDEPDVWENASE